MIKSVIIDIDYMEFYVANSFQAAIFYKTVLGFDIIAYGGEETGLVNKKSYILEQGTIRFIISSSTEVNSIIRRHVVRHDDAVGDIAFLSENVEITYNLAIDNGASSLLSPTEMEEGGLKFKIASVSCFGDTTHTFIQRKNGDKWFIPFYRPFENGKSTSHIGLFAIDHVAIALEMGCGAQIAIW